MSGALPALLWIEGGGLVAEGFDSDGMGLEPVGAPRPNITGDGKRVYRKRWSA